MAMTTTDARKRHLEKLAEIADTVRDLMDDVPEIEETSGGPAGGTWNATLPCPDCGKQTVIGYKLVNETGEHMHTRFFCTFWPSTLDLVGDRTVRCGWSGWTVPGWKEE